MDKNTVMKAIWVAILLQILSLSPAFCGELSQKAYLVFKAEMMITRDQAIQNGELLDKSAIDPSIPSCSFELKNPIKMSDVVFMQVHRNADPDSVTYVPDFDEGFPYDSIQALRCLSGNGSPATLAQIHQSLGKFVAFSPIISREETRADIKMSAPASTSHFLPGLHVSFD